MKQPLPKMPRLLAAYTGGPTRPYAYCYRAALDARIPVDQADNGRYDFDDDDIPGIAQEFGLKAISRAA